MQPAGRDSGSRRRGASSGELLRASRSRSDSPGWIVSSMYPCQSYVGASPDSDQCHEIAGNTWICAELRMMRLQEISSCDREFKPMREALRKPGIQGRVRIHVLSGERAYETVVNIERDSFRQVEGRRQKDLVRGAGTHDTGNAANILGIGRFFEAHVEMGIRSTQT